MVPSGNIPEILEPPSLISGGGHPIDAEFTWEQAVRVLRKNFRFVLVFVALVTVGVTVAAFMIKDFYTSVARVEIDPLATGMKTLGEIQWNTDQSDENYVDTQAQL